jgi:hypothetical protein
LGGLGGFEGFFQLIYSIRRGYSLRISWSLGKGTKATALKERGMR